VEYPANGDGDVMGAVTPVVINRSIFSAAQWSSVDWIELGDHPGSYD